MKCRICGYELKPEDKSCPMCGTKVTETDRRGSGSEDLMFRGLENEDNGRRSLDEADLSWNTYDFPKPKKPRDIEMRWTSNGVQWDSEKVSSMAKDASEGFASIPSREPARQLPPDPVWPGMNTSRETIGKQPSASAQTGAVQDSFEQTARMVNSRGTQTGPQTAHPAAPSQPAYTQPQQPVHPAAPQAPVYTQPQTSQPESRRQSDNNFGGTWRMPEQKEAPNTPLWYTQQMPPVQPQQTAYTQPQQPVYSAPYAQPQTMPPYYTQPQAPVYTAPVPTPAYPQPQQPVSTQTGPQMFTASGYINTQPLWQTTPPQPVMPTAPPVMPQPQAMPSYYTQPQQPVQQAPVYTQPQAPVYTQPPQPSYSTPQTPADYEQQRAAREKNIEELLNQIPEFRETPEANGSAEYEASRLAEILSSKESTVPAGPESTVPATEVPKPQEQVAVEPVSEPEAPAQAPSTDQAEAEPQPAASEPPAETPAGPSEAPEEKSEQSAEQPDHQSEQPEQHAEEAKPADDAWLAENVKKAAPNPKYSKFNTFYSKNEEFQELLNKQYEKLSAFHAGEAAASFDGSERFRAQHSLYTPSAAVKAEDINSFENMLLEGTKSAAGDETIVLERNKISKAADTAAQAQDTAAPVPAKEADLAQTLVAGAETEAVRKAAEAAAQQDGHPVDQPSPTADTDVKRPVTRDEKIDRDTVEMRLMQIREQETLETKAREDRRQMFDDLTKSRSASFGDLEEALKADVNKTFPPVPKKEKTEQEKTKEVVKTSEKKSGVPTITSQLRDLYEYQEEHEDEDQREHRKHGFWNSLFIVLLVIALLIGLFKLAVIVLNRIMPDAIATDIITQIDAEATEKAGEYFGMAKDKINGWIRPGAVQQQLEEEDQPVEAEPDKQSEEQPSAAPPESLSLAEQLAADIDTNGNIASVRENPELKYSADRGYAVEGLDDMDVVASEDVIKSLWSVMIGYNAAWIDYVNNNDLSCLDFLKSDGAAFSSASSFNADGTTESFESLELGEVRTDGTYYYLFDKETIKVTTNGNTATDTSEALYRLVLDGETYKILDYSTVS